MRNTKIVSIIDADDSTVVCIAVLDTGEVVGLDYYDAKQLLISQMVPKSAKEQVSIDKDSVAFLVLAGILNN